MTSTESNKNNRHYSVFISYAHEDIDKAKSLYDELKFAGLDPWLDDKSIIAGEKWKIAIEETIINSRFFVVPFSSLEKNTYVQKEIEYALDLMEKLT